MWWRVGGVASQPQPGIEQSATEDAGLADGINLVAGRVTHATVAESLKLPVRAVG